MASTLNRLSFFRLGRCAPTPRPDHPSASYPRTQTSPQQYRRGEVMFARRQRAQNILRSERKMFRNVDVAAMCQEALRETYGDEKSISKAIADDTGMSPSAADNWTAGENPMSLVAFLNAFHNNPKFQAHARKILLMEKEINPAFEAELASFVRAVQQYGAPP